MNTRHQLRTMLSAFMFQAILFTSCKKDLIEPKSIVDADVESTAPRAIFANRDLNWNSWADGTYTTARAVSDFGNISGFSSTEEDRTYVIYDALRVKLIANAQDAGSGVVATIDIENHSAYELHYEVKVGSTFDWAAVGGKLGFGLLLGDGYTGGQDVSDGNGGSFRLAWGVSPTSGESYFRPYAYYVDQPTQYGQGFSTRYPAAGSSIQNNTWYDIRLFAQANTYSNYNGKIKLTINNTVVYQDDTFRWTTNHSKRLINTMTFHTFRGGGTGSESSTVGYVYYDTFHLNNITAVY